VPFLQKFCFDAELAITGADDIVLNRQVSLGSIPIYSDNLRNSISFCASVDKGVLAELEFSVYFNASLYQVPALDVSLNYQNSYCMFNIFDWTRDSTFFQWEAIVNLQDL
jgi:hypothetical protein